MDINIDPSCSRTIDPDRALSSSLGTDVTMVLDGSVVLSDWQRTSNSVVQTLSSLTQPPMATGAFATDLNKDPNCSRVMYPDMVPSHSLGPVVKVASDGSTACPDLPGPSGSMINMASGGGLDHGHLHYLWW